jgi:hypothetical protein
LKVRLHVFINVLSVFNSPTQMQIGQKSSMTQILRFFGKL